MFLFDITVYPSSISYLPNVETGKPVPGMKNRWVHIYSTQQSNNCRGVVTLTVGLFVISSIWYQLHVIGIFAGISGSLRIQ